MMEFKNLIAEHNEIANDLSLMAEDTLNTFENPKIVMNPYGIAPLTAVFIFQTDEKTNVEVSVFGNDITTIQYNSDKKVSKHVVPIVGLLMNQATSIQLKLGSGEVYCTELTPEVNFNKLYLPKRIDISSQDNQSDELYLMMTTSNNYPYIIDSDGHIRWFIQMNLNFDISKLSNGHLISGSHERIGETYYSKSLCEFNWLGRIIKYLDIPGGYHHDAIEYKNESLLVLANKEKSEILEDILLQVDMHTGNVIKSWDFSTILPAQLSPSVHFSSQDWCHANSLFYIEEKDELWISSRHLDIIFCFSLESEALKYIIGDPQGWSDRDIEEYFLLPAEDEFEWQYEQHDLNFIDHNHISCFDNGGRRSKKPMDYKDLKDCYSRGVIYRIDRDKKKIYQTYQYGKERGHHLYSPYISSFDSRPYNCYITFGGISTRDGIPTEHVGFRYIDNPQASDIELKSISVDIINGEIIREISIDDQIYRSRKIKAQIFWE